VRDERIDVVLATLPSTGMRHPGAPLAVVVHDLRHELRPAQFSRGRRLLRRVSYDRAYALADLIVSVSQRTLDDLHRLHPATAATPSVVVHHGADHVLTWGGAAGTGPAVAFAHHTNKNPDLVIAGWADATSRGEPMPRLTLLGAGSDRERLAALAADRGVGHLVEPVPYLPDQELRGVFGNAAMVVLPSDLEGFGLPIVEGMLLGIPVVIGPDPAALEVAGGHAAVMDGWTPRALADAVAEAGRFDADRLVAARAHAAAFTWRRSAEQTRSALASISRP
jgi:glycosyltransferase involved in cell wall biosynthesis